MHRRTRHGSVSGIDRWDKRDRASRFSHDHFAGHRFLTGFLLVERDGPHAFRVRGYRHRCHLGFDGHQFFLDADDVQSAFEETETHRRVEA